MSYSVSVIADQLVEEVIDVYVPRLRKFRREEGIQNRMQFLDIVTTWKGINFGVANEIYFWNWAMREALESLIEEELIAQYFSTHPDVDKLSSSEQIHSLHSFIKQIGFHIVPVQIKYLTTMLLSLHSSYGQGFNWLLESTYSL